ncbi:MAG: 4a-hydroxytetrahydrobiopterin dehydratase [Candidatus Paceibacterota bacterium]
MTSNKNLVNKKCIACEGTEKPFTTEEIANYTPQVPDWQVKNDKALEREFVLTDFTAALTLVNHIGQLAEDEGHHPDICLHDYKKVTVTISTHVIDGLSENDFILAAKIDQL